MKEQSLYLTHILECIERIERYAHPGKSTFLEETMRQDAIYRNLEVIGEAARNLNNETRQQMSSIPWKKVIGLRNVLIHAYEGIDPAEVWGIVIQEIPKLKEAILGLQH